jgi:hypothetical protein
VVLVSLAKQTADAWVGGILLASGFGAQLAQSVGARPKWATLQLTIPVACAILALGLLLLCCVLRPWNVKRAQTQHLIFTLEALHEADLLKSWRKTIVDGAKNLGREIRPGESPARLAISVLGEGRWAKATAGVDLPDDVLEPHPNEGG